MIRHLALNLELIETLTLVQSVGVRSTASGIDGHKRLCVVVCIGSWLLSHSSIATIIISRIAIGVVNEALFLEEIATASLFLLVHLLRVVVVAILLEGIVLDVNLPVLITPIRHKVLLDHLNQTNELAALDLLRVEVVCFSYVEVRDYIVGRLSHQQIAIQLDVMVELLVISLNEVIHDG